MSNKFFYVKLTLLSTLVCFLTAKISYIVMSKQLAILFFSQFSNLLANYILVGFGMGLPLVLLASVLSWLQLLLLLAGEINPHLAKEGFVNVIKTLFNKF